MDNHMINLIHYFAFLLHNMHRFTGQFLKRRQSKTYLLPLYINRYCIEQYWCEHIGGIYLIYTVKILGRVEYIANGMWRGI